VSRTFEATLSLTLKDKTTQGKVPIDTAIVAEMGLKPGEALRASMRGKEFTAKVSGSLKTPGLQVPMDIINALKLRDGQGVRVTVLGRA